jgi:hypothetical protein
MLQFDSITKSYIFHEGEDCYTNNITRYADNRVTIEWRKNDEIITDKKELSRLNSEANSPDPYV